uniref:Beta-galactosidase n=1 Tax=Schlesneria paludicola TaxID=360056 RepID=A0A7C4LKS5_9PLAN
MKWTLFAAGWMTAWLPLTVVGEWQPKTAPVMTRWARDVTPEKVHPEYPRPQMVRPHWLNLNGLWDYALTPREGPLPQTWDGQILVPFPIESALSGVMKTVGPDQRLWYRRTFSLPAEAAWRHKTILLHFGAVDWDCTVWVNGAEVGRHRGGYDPFSFDITPHLKAEGLNELVIAVWDPTDAGYQPRGKQVRNPHGIWYTSVTGIWQTVWLEPVPNTHLRGLTITPDVDRGGIDVLADVAGGDARSVALAVRCDYTFRRDTRSGSGSAAAQVASATQPVKLDLGQPARDLLWSPANPQLLDMVVELRDAEGRVIDRVQTYTALRKISLGKDQAGVVRILLNNQPLFQYGPLDQGWWPDGLYTAPTDEALKFDIEITKKYGFNMIRKHVKVEPQRWYYWTDKLGLLVWQDMPSGDQHAPWDPFGKHNGEEIVRTPESADNFRREWQRIIDSRRNHPSIVMWVPFNEAWGQFDTVAVTRWTKEYDPTRLVNCASGGNDFPVGDVIDVHRYPGPVMVEPSSDRAGVLGEFGGLGLPLKGHTWQSEKNWGYRSFTSQEALTEAYLDLIDKLHPLIGRGLSAAVYTQTTDVEIEVNGLLTYDRAVEKIPVATAARAHQQLWEPAPKVTTLLPTAETSPAVWKFTTEQPAEGWHQADFSDAAWTAGTSGFGEPSTPGAQVNTLWKSPDIWLRRTFDLPTLPKGELRLRMHHDEDAAVYLNGVLIKRVSGYTTEYVSLRLSAEAQRALRVGRNTLAVHCHQTGGGQYIDLGLEVWER